MITNEGTGFDSSYIAGIFEYQHILKEIDKWFNQDSTSTLTFKNNLSEILSRPSRLNVEGWLCLCYSYSKNQISLKVHNFKDWLHYGDFSENEAIVTFDDIWLYPLNNDSVFLKKFESGITTEEVFQFVQDYYKDIVKQMTLKELDFDVILEDNLLSLEQMKKGNLSTTNRNFWESKVADYSAGFILRRNKYDLIPRYSGTPICGVKLNDYFTTIEKTLAERLAQSEFQIDYKMLFRMIKVFQLSDNVLKYYFIELSSAPYKESAIKFLDDDLVETVNRLYPVTSESERTLVYTNFLKQLHHEDILKIIVLRNTSNDERYNIKNYTDIDMLYENGRRY